MLRRRPSEDDAPIAETNVLPVMNIMFLLIPALLLAMEVASMASVAVSPPQFRNAPSEPGDPPKTEGLKLSVTILADGFRVSSAIQAQGAAAGQAQDSRTPTIPLARPDAPRDDYERYDYVALEDLAQEFKRKHRDETVVRVSAENDVPVQVLINTMDAQRGTDCKLANLKADDEMPSECLFFRPIVEAGAG